MSNSLIQPLSGSGLYGVYLDSWVLQTIMIVFLAVALYNGMELIILILFSFNHYNGLFFWAMLLTSVLGVLPYAIGYLLEFFAFGPLWLGLTLSTIGFYAMVPGQSVVLYSQLHLIVQSPRVLNFVFYLVAFDAAFLLIPTTVLEFSDAYIGSVATTKGFNVMERLQLTWFCAQEFFISYIYIHTAAKLLRPLPQRDDHRYQVMFELLAVNSIVILMNIALLVLEYVGLYPLQVAVKAAVYSVKLKLELGVLSKLVGMTLPTQPVQFLPRNNQFPTFVDPTRITTDFTHAAPPDSGGPHIRRPRIDGSMESLNSDSIRPAFSHRPSLPS